MATADVISACHTRPDGRGRGVRRMGIAVMPVVLLSALCLVDGGALAIKTSRAGQRNTLLAKGRLPNVVQIHVEPTARCQLAGICAACPLQRNERGEMPFGLFKGIFGGCESVITPGKTLFTFNGFGEGPLHQDFFRMVRHVTDRGYRASWSSNALSVTREHIAAVSALDPSKLGASDPVTRVRNWSVDSLDDHVIYAAKMAPGLERSVGEETARTLENNAVRGQIELMTALSAHPEAAAFRRVIRFDTLYGESKLLNEARERLGFLGRSELVHDWAGQVALATSKIQAPERPCDRLDPDQGEVKLQVTTNGDTSVCCFDHHEAPSGPPNGGSAAPRTLRMYVGKMPEQTLEQILWGELFGRWWDRALAGRMHETAMCGSCNRCPDGPNAEHLDRLFAPEGTL